MGFTRLARALTVSAISWLLVSLMHALAAYTDQLHRGVPGALGPLIGAVVPSYLPWVPFSAILYFLFIRLRDRWSDVSAVASIVAGAFCLFFLPEIAYQALWSQWQEGVPLSNVLSALAAWPAIFWLVDFGLFVSTIAVVYGAVAFSRHLEGERRKQRLVAENLTLRLELERQRLVALRAQLEPHFLFNALNAISGLVRGDNRSLALSALQQLSSLLRYALTASGRDWVPIADELAFARGYVALQQLRHGDRLRCVFDADERSIVACDVPPLILQPLLENAIRHDLERHEGAGDIHLDVQRDGEQLRIRVSNSLPAGLEPNPGTGFGLTATRDRLSLIYGRQAVCASGVVDGRFVATLTVPISTPVAARPA